MRLLPVWLMVASFVVLLAGLAAWVWLRHRLETYLRARHPVEASALFVPPNLARESDEEKLIARQGDARFRLEQFIASGAAARLDDRLLDRWLVARTWLKRSMSGVAILFIALALFFGLQG